MAKICNNCACYEVCIYANLGRTKDCTLWQPEVVRCKDCKDHDRCEVEDLLVKFQCIENAYCAAGERKDNG